MSAGNWKDMFQGIQKGDVELVDYYLQIGVDPNHQHPEFMALPLVESVRFNHLDIAKLLLENGADPKLKEDWGGATAYSVALAADNKKAILLLRQYIESSS